MRGASRAGSVLTYRFGGGGDQGLLMPCWRLGPALVSVFPLGWLAVLLGKQRKVYSLKAAHSQYVGGGLQQPQPGEIALVIQGSGIDWHTALTVSSLQAPGLEREFNAGMLQQEANQIGQRVSEGWFKVEHKSARSPSTRPSVPSAIPCQQLCAYSVFRGIQ
ncbi:hypothetical protein GWK47_029253 [Chionoecetes opilio]|uniref:Uncharacterized protein n=1 Tax=Chionoecetes opilio TaxID=41210 RepID=A0A8J4YSN0_CHIOP|nr:hypothetical protein GWK47_029253 [Chionoecetes opilio]